MPWKEETVVNTRMKFALRLESGDKMAQLCREFGISRKTGYKIWKRYQSEGPRGLYDRSSRPKRLAKLISPFIENKIVQLKHEKPTWGAPKLHELFKKRYSKITVPAISTIHCILDRNDLVNKKRRKRFRAQGTFLRETQAPNQLWCADFKGQFRLGDKSYCYPLTITDHFSRYIISCEALESIKREAGTIDVFEQAFREYGLPEALRTDNGAPFAARSYFGLSKLSIWWLRLGIKIERIEPGNPQQNGRHERMHLTLKQDTVRPPCKNLLQQQERFDHFVDSFNQDRPHQALDMRYPGQIYKTSSKQYPEKLPDLEYPFHDKINTVSCVGQVNVNGKGCFASIGTPFAGQRVGLREMEEKLWLISFMDYDLGYFSEKDRIFSPFENPFQIPREDD